MRSLSDTLARLKHFRPTQSGLEGESRLAPFGAFGTNPGELEARIHVPAKLTVSPALVVVLHGCTQTAATYDKGSGWSKLADEYGFVVLFPQQTRSNNANLCFNWFQPNDIARDRGEALSIRQMIKTAETRHDIDRSRVYITGLSAGGAMANVMLATYPEVFAAGAIIAGLPYGTARTVPQAFDRMRAQGIPDGHSLQKALRGASKSNGPWPAISVWHGTQDATVSSANADAIVEQWQDIHEVKAAGHSDASRGRLERAVWVGPDGRERLQLYRIKGMGHGTPIDVKSGYGQAGPYMLDVGISSTEEIARSFGIVAPSLRQVSPGAKIDVPAPTSRNADSQRQGGPADGIRRTIEDALRAAGLMR
ncbi:extracellular catalytic domain type 1 short-chain-length polyhydroxyalkanoate depolymerase [Ensifer sp. 4252]|uniref:extracellular catalytic domain type 1 short-chain-length polyhydroxyalkanoate depolymerase n=1 Tax=Ensifer sp. 4252 TaxID=3373915 RepID=UPI003D1F48F4